jgi:hypothetical protein
MGAADVLATAYRVHVSRVGGSARMKERTAETPPIRKSADYMPGQRGGRTRHKLGSILANSLGDLPFLASAILI